MCKKQNYLTENKIHVPRIYDVHQKVYFYLFQLTSDGLAYLSDFFEDLLDFQHTLIFVTKPPSIIIMNCIALSHAFMSLNEGLDYKQTLETTVCSLQQIFKDFLFFFTWMTGKASLLLL